MEFRMAFRQQAMARSVVLHDFVAKSTDFESIVEKVWGRVDANHNGTVDVHELYSLSREAASRLGRKPPDEQGVRALLQRHDRNGNGVIDRDEFSGLIEE